VATDSFDVELPERLASIIGGVVLGSSKRDAKLPSLLVEDEAEPPSWADACQHVGLVRLLEGTWHLAEE